MPGSICHPTRPCRCYGLAARQVPARVCLICRHSGQASQWVSDVFVVVADVVAVVVLRVPWRWSCFARLYCGVEAPPAPQRSGHGHELLSSRVVPVLRREGLGGFSWSESGQEHAEETQSTPGVDVRGVIDGLLMSRS